jgi:anti-sigma-K factor RskA
MSESDRERDERIAAFLLGELDDAERADFERRLAHDPELRAEAAAIAPVVAQLDSLPEEAWNPVEPPPLALPVAEIPAAAPEARRKSRWRWRPAMVAAGGALAAVVVALVIGFGALESGDEIEPISVELTPLGGGAGNASGELVLTGDSGSQARLTVTGLEPSVEDFYEVWLLSDDGLVSLGSFRVGDGGSAELDLQIPVDAARYDSFDISLEPDDGDPEHSGDSVLRGPTPA